MYLLAIEVVSVEVGRVDVASLTANLTKEGAAGIRRTNCCSSISSGEAQTGVIVDSSAPVVRITISSSSWLEGYPIWSCSMNRSNCASGRG